MKHEDSFLYLSAIEGLSIAAAVFPDTVIVLLAEQFSRQSLTPDCRLKVGEALVRVIKLLGNIFLSFHTCKEGHQKKVPTFLKSVFGFHQTHTITFSVVPLNFNTLFQFFPPV